MTLSLKFNLDQADLFVIFAADGALSIGLKARRCLS